MPTSFVPIALKGIDVSDRKQLQAAWFQLCDFVSVSLTATGIANLLNGQGLLTGSALANGTLTATQMSHIITDLGTITTDQTVNANSNQFVFIRLVSGTTQTRTLTINNLPQGAILEVNVGITANTLTLKMAATDPTSTAYAAINGFLSTTGATTSLITTGVATSTGNIFLGMTGFSGTSATPILQIFYS